MKNQIKPCSCEESAHLPKALAAIHFICTNDTKQPMVEDLAQCGNLAAQGQALEELEGDPAVGDIAERTSGLVP